MTKRVESSHWIPVTGMIRLEFTSVDPVKFNRPIECGHRLARPIRFISPCWDSYLNKFQFANCFEVQILNCLHTRSVSLTFDFA